MKLFLPGEVWLHKRGFTFDKKVDYLPIGFHGGQDFFTAPVGKIPVIAPCNGELFTFPNFSKSAGWWGYFRFQYSGEVYSLKILHMYKELSAGKYKEGDILGYCGGTGLHITSKYGISYIGPSDEEQLSDRSVPHLHVELHKGDYKHDTNRNKVLALERLIDPVKTFEKWLSEQSANEQLVRSSNNVIFYKEKGQSSVYIKGSDSMYYPIISGQHFIALFGNWENNTIIEVDNLSPKSDIYFGLFKSDSNSKYDSA